MYVYFKRIRLFASLIVFYMYYYTYNAWKNIYTEKKEVFFRDFSINIPINLFCEIFSHLINALQFLKISQCRSSIYLIWELILNINVSAMSDNSWISGISISIVIHTALNWQNWICVIQWIDVHVLIIIMRITFTYKTALKCKVTWSYYINNIWR